MQFTCPTNMFYDLGTKEETNQLPMFQLTGHTVRRNEPANILHYTRNPPEIVTEVPGSLLKVGIFHD